MSNIIEEAIECVNRERSGSTEVLRYLRSIEKDKLFAPRGYSSLFAFCCEELNYSEPEAQLRIQAMRLMRVVPVVEGLLKAGKLSLSVAALLQSAIRREKIPREERAALVRDFVGTSKRRAQRQLATRFPKAPRREKATPISATETEIRFTVNAEEMALIQAELDRTSHSNFERSFKVLFLSALKKQKTKEKPAQDTAPQRPLTRHIPKEIQRKIWERDGGSCQYMDPVTGNTCRTRHGVQIDHIKPYSEGGNHAPENLRLLCGTHNRHRWQMNQAS